MYAFERLIRVLAVACVLTAAACSGAPQPTGSDSIQNPPANSAAQPAVAPSPAALTLPVDGQGQPLVARVNDVGIPKALLDREIVRLQQQASGDPGALQISVMETLIQQELIDQAAAKQSIQVTDADIEGELNTNVQIAGSDANWQKWLTDNQYTDAEFRGTVRDMLITSRMRDQITQALNGPIMQVHARHILVATQAEAQGILDRLTNGDDFGTLATQYSKDVTTKSQGGDLGWFTQDELLQPNLAQVAFTIQPGTYAGPIATTLGFHVVQTLEKAERPIPDDKRAVLAQARFENWLQSLYQGATIERYL